MKRKSWILAILVLGCITAAGCGKQQEADAAVESGTKNELSYGMEATAPKMTVTAVSEAETQKEETEAEMLIENAMAEHAVQHETGTDNTKAVIGEDAAKEKALAAAGVVGSQAGSADGQPVGSNDGSADGQPAGSNGGSHNGSLGGQSGTQAQGSAQSDTLLTQEEAIAFALARVPGASAEHVYIELEKDDGHWKYEGEIYYNRKEYEFELNAANGQILEWSEEEDDD